MTFFSNRAGQSDLWTRRADGSASAELELDAEETIWEPQWSPDSEWLIYRQGGTAAMRDIMAVRVGQDAEPIALAATEFEESGPALSPNGRWLAYSSNETGQPEVYVVPFPNAGDAKWPISANGGNEPVWSHSGRELFYRNEAGELVAVQVETEATFTPGQSEVLFPAAEFRSFPIHAQYDVTPDDERFIMIRNVRGDQSGELTVVVNWFEELRERAGSN